MKFENTEVMGFKRAMHGMRNPKKSYHKNDTVEWTDDEGYHVDIGPNDLKLAQTLIRAGSEHRKFMRQIFVSVDITAPIYWWKEFDTYKVATVRNSTSTMHTLANEHIDESLFETDDFIPKLILSDSSEGDHTITTVGDAIHPFLGVCEKLRDKYLETNDKRYWKELIRWLPSGFLQTATVTMNYENLLGMCSKGQRRFHKLNEWSGVDDHHCPNFINWARSLPYAQELIFGDELDKNETSEDSKEIQDKVDTSCEQLFYLEKRFTKYLTKYYQNLVNAEYLPNSITIEITYIQQQIDSISKSLLKYSRGEKVTTIIAIQRDLIELENKINEFEKDTRTVE